MSTMFDEAIADAKKLREIAEANAKQQLMEAMLPSIRLMIEQEIMGDEESEVTFEDLIMDPESIEIEEVPETATPEFNVSVDVAGDAHIAVSSGDVTSEEEIETVEEEPAEEELMTLTPEAAYALASLIKGHSPAAEKNSLFEKMQVLKRKIRKFSNALNAAGIERENVTLREIACKHYTQLLKEIITLRSEVILTEGAENKKIARSAFKDILKEMKKMSRRHARALFDKLFEGDHTEKMDELDVVLSSDDLDVLGVEDEEEVSVDDLDVDVLLSTEEVEEPAEEVEVEDEEVELEELDLVLTDDDFEVLGVDSDEVTVDDLDVEVMMGEPAEEEVDVEVEEEEVELEEVYEIDEGMLRRELRRMRRLREQDEGVDDDVASASWVDGEVVGDVVLDVDEDDLLNALDDELGTVTAVAESRRRARRLNAKRAARLRNGRNTGKSSVNESRRNRVLRKKVVGYHKSASALKNQLVEMNLFNAKLLYVNKLMQNRDLNAKQQRAIVEALDSAKTLREAKLLYKSLTKSLKKRSNRSGLNESKVARTLGSSSRSTRSASVSRNGNEVNRWAVLAGINKDNK